MIGCRVYCIWGEGVLCGMFVGWNRVFVVWNGGFLEGVFMDRVILEWNRGVEWKVGYNFILVF